MGSLDGKVAVITGAGSGMAKASVKVFAREGAKIVAGDISGAEEDTAKEVQAVGGDVVPVHCDVTKEADIEAPTRSTRRASSTRRPSAGAGRPTRSPRWRRSWRRTRPRSSPGRSSRSTGAGPPSWRDRRDRRDRHDRRPRRDRKVTDGCPVRWRA